MEDKWRSLNYGFARCVSIIMFCLGLVGIAYPARAGTAYASFVVGKMTNITSIPSGLMVIMDAGPPTNCGTSASYGWMLIPQENQAMTALALSYWLAGKRDVTIYTNANSGTGYCIVGQMDPAD